MARMVERPFRVLVVDDDRSIRDAICQYLGRRHISVRGVSDAQAMDAALLEESAELIVLDLMMPGEDGLSVCRRLLSHVPILMISATGDAADRIVGLECGADDYLAKPFDPRELLARINSIRRRTYPADCGGDPHPTYSIFKFEGWAFDPVERQLSNPAGLTVMLTAGEASLLRAFLIHPRQLLSRNQLLDHSRGSASESYDRAIDLAVSRLRRKLMQKDREMIETVRGEGYRFVAAVSQLSR